MANITKEERERRATLASGGSFEPQDDNQFLEADEDANRVLEPFERPVEKVTADQPTPSGKVKIRVLPKGDGKIATGKYDRQINAFTYHKKGDHLFVHESIAKTQEDNGLVEIVDGD